MSRFSLIPSVAMALAAGCAANRTLVPTGPRSHAPTPTTGAITSADLMTRLYIFANDSMLGRESGQLGNVRGTNYIAAEMQKMGLRPGGEHGTYFQTVPVLFASIAPGFTFSVADVVLSPWRDIVPSLGSSNTRPLVGAISTVFGGRIGGAMISPAQAAGKVVILLPALHTTARQGSAATALAQAESLAPLMRSAVAIAHVTPDSAILAIVAHLPQSQEELGVAPGSVSDPIASVLVLSAAGARRLFGAVALNGLAVGTAGRTLDANFVVSRVAAPYPARNVIGILPGSDPSLRGQYVALGAHNDHIGIAARPLDHDSVLANNMVIRRAGAQNQQRRPTAVEAARIAELRDSLARSHGGARPDSVNNGADDDGSGTVAMLEIAERFATAANRPRRSLIFVSHTGEEKGLWGSLWFTDHPTVPRDSIVVQLNMDMVGRGKDTDIMGRGPNNVQLIGSRRLSSQLGDLIDAVNAARTPRMDIDASFDTNGHPLNRYCRSDHYMYARYGIPVTYFSLGYHTDYHQVTDEPQYIDYDHMARVAAFVYDVAEAVANRTQRLVVDGPKMNPQGECRQ